MVSIHAPAKGATADSRLMTALLCFNPRTREGCDSEKVYDIRLPESFNPRTRKGATNGDKGKC